MTSRSSLQILELKRRLAVAVAKLKEWAAECGECDGTGLAAKTPSGEQSHIEHCQECLDIREAIEDLEMPL